MNPHSHACGMCGASHQRTSCRPSFDARVGLDAVAWLVVRLLVRLRETYDRSRSKYFRIADGANSGLRYYDVFFTGEQCSMWISEDCVLRLVFQIFEFERHIHSRECLETLRRNKEETWIRHGH